MKEDIRQAIRGASKCIICRNGADAASEFEWFSPILSDWLCETHCAELQMGHYPDTRRRLAQLIGHSGDERELMAACHGGPFANL